MSVTVNVIVKFSLFELKENDSVVMSTIIKKICHEIEAC